MHNIRTHTCSIHTHTHTHTHNIHTHRPDLRIKPPPPTVVPRIQVDKLTERAAAATEAYRASPTASAAATVEKSLTRMRTAMAEEEALAAAATDCRRAVNSLDVLRASLDESIAALAAAQRPHPSLKLRGEAERAANAGAKLPISPQALRRFELAVEGANAMDTAAEKAEATLLAPVEQVRVSVADLSAAKASVAKAGMTQPSLARLAN
eukprot:373111-Pleurochrysis_carterae.AAC.1